RGGVWGGGGVVGGGQEGPVRGKEGGERGDVALSCADKSGARETERIEALKGIRRRGDDLPRRTVPALEESRARETRPGLAGCVHAVARGRADGIQEVLAAVRIGGAG